MLAHALLYMYELFIVFTILFHVKVSVGPMLSFQKRKRVTIYQNKLPKGQRSLT